MTFWAGDIIWSVFAIAIKCGGMVFTHQAHICQLYCSEGTAVNDDVQA